MQGAYFILAGESDNVGGKESNPEGTRSIEQAGPVRLKKKSERSELRKGFGKRGTHWRGHQAGGKLVGQEVGTGEY